MRIGFDITALYVAQGGVFSYDFNLLRALIAQEQDEYLLLDYAPLHRRSGELPESRDLEAPNARIARCGGPRVFRLAHAGAAQWSPAYAVAGWLDRTLLRPWSAAAERAMQRSLAPALAGMDVFHSSDVLQRRQPGAHNVITLYDLTVLLFPGLHTPRNRDLQWRKYRFAQEQADAVIAISESTKRDAVTHLGIPADRVHVVHAGVGPEFRPLEREDVAQALAPLGLKPGGYVLFVGTLEPRKNLLRLMEAYARLRRELPAPAPKLVLAGARGWRHREILARCAALGLQDEVRYLGPVPAALLPALYNGALVFAYPSLYEGFGLPPLEALACGTPVLTSNTSSLPEVIGDAGVLVDPRDVEALAGALASLVSDDGIRAALREAGPRRARAFTWEESARKLSAIYHRLGEPPEPVPRA